MEIMKQTRSTRTESFGDDEFQITNALLLITRTRSFRFWNVVRVQFKILGIGTRTVRTTTFAKENITALLPL